MTRPRHDQGPDYERGFIDGMLHQMQSSVDKAVNQMAQKRVTALYIASPQPETPPECVTEEEKKAFAFGWWKAMEAQRLAQPKQEPVALPCCGYTDASAIKWNPYNQVVQCHNCGQVYTAPPQRTWIGLTDEDKASFWKADQMTHEEWQQLFAEVEAKLKEKNT
jgi:hypothetical protein